MKSQAMDVDQLVEQFKKRDAEKEKEKENGDEGEDGSKEE